MVFVVFFMEISDFCIEVITSTFICVSYIMGWKCFFCLFCGLKTQQEYNVIAGCCCFQIRLFVNVICAYDFFCAIVCSIVANSFRILFLHAIVFFYGLLYTFCCIVITWLHMNVDARKSTIVLHVRREKGKISIKRSTWFLPVVAM